MLMKSLFPFLTILLSLAVCPSTAHSRWHSKPQNFEINYGGSFLHLRSDANGHGMLLIPNYEEAAFYYSNGAWTSQSIIENMPVMAYATLAVEDSGTALALWSYANIWEAKTAYFDGTSWNCPSPDPFENGDAPGIACVAMNGPGQGMVVWQNFNNPPYFEYSIFSNGSWSAAAPVSLESGGPSLCLAYSKDGTAIAGWTTMEGAMISIFNGKSWQETPTNLAPSGYISDVGIDDHGNAIALFLDSSYNAIASNFNGKTWKNTVLAKADQLNAERITDLVMSRNGTAIAIWKGTGSKGFSNFYNGTTWEASRQFASDIGPATTNGSNVSISINDKGNGLVVWSTASSQVKSSRLPFGGAWKPAEIVEAHAPKIGYVTSSLSANGEGFAGWMDLMWTNYYVNATIGPIPPSAIRKEVLKNKFAMQTDCINVISWTPSPDPSVVSYDLRRNGVLIATIPSTGPFSYSDHNRCKFHDVYDLTAVDDNGLESTPLTVAIK